MKNIDKKELIKKLNNYNIISIQEEYEDNIGFYKIIYGEHMTKVSKIDLILQEMRQGFNHVNTRLDKVEGRLDNLEKDVSILKKDVSKLKKDVSKLKKDVSILKQDVTLIKQCPTIKQELIGN